AADCTHDQTCTLCGIVLSSKLGHDYKATVTAPTCTEKGYTTYTCSRCNDSYTDSETDALGHNAGAAADCTHDQTCTLCGIVLSSKLGHDYKDTVTAPTCTEKGYTTHTCSRCNDSYTDSEVATLEHNAGDWIIDIEAAPGVEGSKHKECTVCGTTLETAVIEALPVETEPPAEAPTEEPTEAPTEEPTEAPTEPSNDTESETSETSANTSAQTNVPVETNEPPTEAETSTATDSDRTSSSCSSTAGSQITLMVLLMALVPLAAVKRKKETL
ncbi:MAG: hypothetical protein IJW90_05105, partial [Clostridia bacterium]|nr:hypothetical protein [Clostridia bacterium]